MTLDEIVVAIEDYAREEYLRGRVTDSHMSAAALDDARNIGYLQGLHEAALIADRDAGSIFIQDTIVLRIRNRIAEFKEKRGING